MWQNTVTQSELQNNFAGLVSRIKEGQELVVMDEQTPLARIVPMAHPKSQDWDQLRVRFAEFEFPFP